MEETLVTTVYWKNICEILYRKSSKNCIDDHITDLMHLIKKAISIYKVAYSI